jgi:hypothetical protein
MSRTQKEKLEAYPHIPLQLEPEISTEESAVKAADDYNLESSPEKRRKDVDKPLYLRRV